MTAQVLRMGVIESRFRYAWMWNRNYVMLTSKQYSLGFGAINFGVAVIATFLIDKVGRRLLLLTTFPLMSVLQLAIGLSFHAPEAHIHGLVVAFTYLFCVAYSIGEGPIPAVSSQQCDDALDEGPNG